ncbi:CPBP family intramembrane metalloprotease [Rhodobacter sp. Har01]|uniref:CPBP family glutamic-type intramembrane protease n=1 Tax=Rhodobacter sp. Har01 TaxID=2883999 RepID=UPI001D076E90|nr:type II CAAX endopeptidase family protein [Rhodobacter sp. Har01]MCB6180133.1 CPBP family intramembrane metalloprotease [Rhodobacter sp. Har01]
MTFFALTFGWTWGLWAATALLLDPAARIKTLLLLASAFGPSLSGLATVLVFDGPAGLRTWLKRCLAWRLGWGWYATAALAPLAIMALALVLHAALGGVVPATPVTGLLATALIVLQITILGGPLGEEFGWRGYALPVMAQRLGWRAASIALGAVWGLWHLPLFWMPGMAQATLPIGLFMAGSVGLSVVFARLAMNTWFSVLPAILLHAAINSGSWAIPVTPQGGDLRPYAIVTALLLAVAAACLVRPGPAVLRKAAPR